MRRLLLLLCMLGCCVTNTFAEDRLILLVTPQGAWQSTVKDGKPEPWVPMKIAADIIVQGFGTTAPSPPTAPPVIPIPPPAVDPVVEKIAAISKAVLRDKDEAVAVSTIIETVQGLDFSDNDFKEYLEIVVGVSDNTLGADGRIVEWTKQSLFVTSNPGKLKAGLAAAWGVEQSTVDSIYGAAKSPDEVTTGEAINWAKLIAVIKMLLAILENLRAATALVGRLGGTES